MLGYHAQGEDHAAAVEALSKVGREGKQLGNALRVLLGMKTRAGYGAVTVNPQQRTRAGRRASS